LSDGVIAIFIIILVVLQLRTGTTPPGPCCARTCRYCWPTYLTEQERHQAAKDQPGNVGCGSEPVGRR
jgi:hypothetical protein